MFESARPRPSGAESQHESLEWQVPCELLRVSEHPSDCKKWKETLRLEFNESLNNKKYSKTDLISASFKPFLFILRYCFMVCLLSDVASYMGISEQFDS